MKKFLFGICIYIALAIPSLAVMTRDEVMSQQYITGHGHSNEMARLIDLQDSQINGTPTKFHSKAPSWYTKSKPVNFIRQVFIYFDPGLDDEKFMRHDMYYTQRWNDL